MENESTLNFKYRTFFLFKQVMFIFDFSGCKLNINEIRDNIEGIYYIQIETTFNNREVCIEIDQNIHVTLKYLNPCSYYERSYLADYEISLEGIKILNLWLKGEVEYDRVADYSTEMLNME